MHQGRLRLRPWLEEQIESGRYPGVVWLDQVRSVVYEAGQSVLTGSVLFNKTTTIKKLTVVFKK